MPGGDQSYLTTTCCWYNNRMSARPTSVRARPVAPRDSQLRSAIFICARRAVGKIFINFCRALDSKPFSSSTTLGKRPWLRAGHKGYWGALRPCPPSSNCSHQFCQNSNRFRRGCRNVLFSSLQFQEHRAVVFTFPVCPPVCLGENFGVHPKRTNCVF